ncbi:hypothetical protein [Clostridium felsineum]|uniref:Uncharacterized protein n=1 Tax=Clostridium felsineum TaxID=36839 RepID=A0A1S8LDU7_9CLOT|nr:hypothetical protein [Clostridium felsineum]URZ08861.1 hypothetical protein CLROS_042550 [Clostridium felsineum]URZ09489.1 hypothetical protein CROST_001600 [Clostridium felsineum]
MSDSEILDKIQRLHDYAERLRDLSYSFYEDLDITQFQTAGTKNWSGHVKTSVFDNHYKNARDELEKAGDEIEEAISTCKSKMRSLASLISIKDPLKKAQAEFMAYSLI